MAAGLLAEIVNTETEAALYVLEFFSNSSQIKLILDLIKTPRVKDDMKKVEGTNFGCPYLGFCDQPIALLQRLLSKNMKEIHQNQERSTNDFVFAMMSANAADVVAQLLNNLSSKTDISPRGLISLLTFIHDAILNEYKHIIQKVVQACAKTLYSLIRESQLLSIQEWPASAGGGASAVNLIAAQVLRIFNLPYSMVVYDNDISLLNAEFGKSEIIYVAIAVLKYLNSEHIAIAVSLLSRLVFNSDTDRNFAQQFVNAGGLSVIKKYNLLDPENHPNLIIDTLSLIS